MQAWLIALIVGILIYLIMHFVLKITKFALKLAVAGIIAFALYYLLKDTVVALLIR